MRDLLRTIVLGCLLASCTSACDREQSPPSQPPPGSITGRERVGWDQQAPNADELREYSYVLYVDGVAVVLANATCGALGGEGPSAACSSPLPALQPGQHTLELATRITRGGTVLESARSAPLIVTVAGFASTGSASLTAQTTDVQGPDGTRQLIEMVASGLDRPSALARMPDRRLLIAERRGRVRIAEDGRLLDAPALELTDAEMEGGENWSLAVAPDFATTRHVYVSYVARDTGGLRIGRVVRFREAGGTLGEPAVMLDDLPAQAGAPRTRIGPDGALYVGTTALNPRDADDLGSYAGKILRFTTAGVVPLDNPFRFSPVFSFGHRGRLDFDWEPVNKGLWHVETDPGGVSLGRPNSERRGEGAVYLEGIHAVGIAFHAGATPAAWRNSLFLASPDQECLYRVAGLSSSLPEPAVERLLANTFGRIVAVLSGDDGLYFATGNGGTDESGRPADAVFRIRDKGVRTDAPARREP
jgi:glucose/arabinose dehydrogenase